MKLIAEVVRERAESKYLSFLRSLISGEASFPMRIPFPAVAADIAYDRLAEEIAHLSRLERQGGGAGLRLVWKARATRALGRQLIPVEAWLDTEADMGAFLGRNKEVRRFVADLNEIRSQAPELESWLARPLSVKRILEHAGMWDTLLEICRLFIDGRADGRFLRDLPVSVHTKFIEENRGILRELLDHCLPPERVNRELSDFEGRYGLREDRAFVRFRILDPRLHARLGIPLSDFLCSPEEIDRCVKDIDLQDVKFLVIENKVPFLMFPPMPGVVAVFGGGNFAGAFGAMSFLKRVGLFYWGDLDKEGLEIFARFRAEFRHAEPFLMSTDLFERLRSLAVPRQTCQTLETIEAAPLELPADLARLYGIVTREGWRLEQERIPVEELDVARGLL